jgi:F-type H+-transporting ATPase subunit epsilon
MAQRRSHVDVEVQLVSPEKVLFTGEADMVIARTSTGGEIAFLNNHAPFLGALANWHVRVVLNDGRHERFAVHGGFVEVSNNTVIILTDVAELAGEIEIERAQMAKERAEEALRTNPDDADAVAALRRAEVRLDVAGM